MKKILFILLSLPLIVYGQSKDDLFQTSNTNKQFTLSKDNTRKVFFNREIYESKLLKKPHVLNINLPLLDDTYININLIRFSVISPNNQLIIENKKGKTQEEYKSNLVSYRIIYKDESIGVFIVTDNAITATFKFNDKQIEISEINGELLLFDVNDCILTNNFTCSVEKKYNQIIKQPSLNKTVVNTTKCLELALEIDYFTRNTFSSNNSCANWGEAIMAGVSQVYNSEINIEISIVTTIIWETTDPYASYVSDASNMLGALRNHWTLNNSSISRDLVHLLTKRSNTGTGGIAYLDVLCDNSWGYGFSAGLNNTTNFNFPNPPYTWNLLVCSHEIGHNIGSNHTHWCGWPGGPIDNCTDVEGSCTNNPISQVGTIMSYCHTTSSGSLIDFHSLVVSNALMPGINGASCLSTCYYYGCTDPSACNYDPLVTIDDGSCNTVYGCMDPLYIEYDATATCDDGSCISPIPIVLSCVISDASCNPLVNGVLNDGTINLSLTGGIAPYSYIWSNGATTQDINNLLVGNYTITVTDAQGQIVTETYFVSSPSAIDVTIFTTNTSGQGISDGSANVSATGGTPPYIFYWISTDTLSANSDTLVSNNSALSNLETGAYMLYTVDANGCYLQDMVIIENTPSIDYYGCTDPLADNYDATATVDDGSCTYTAPCTDYVTGLNTPTVLEDRVIMAWDNMNTSACTVTKYNVRFREVGTSAWSQKGAGWLGCSTPGGLQKVDRLQLNMNPSTTYEWKMKVWYCDGNSSYWGATEQFTMQGSCPPLTNLAVQTFSGNHTKATFTWDSTATYQYARIKLRVDTVGASWQTVGGFGVYSPTLTVTKWGLVEGESYRAQARAVCHPIMSAWASSWTPLIFWSQPDAGAKAEGGTAITNLDVYPNPSRDIFNISFTSEDVQDLKVRVLNVIGEELINENLQQFIGEYTKQINLEDNAKGIYFLEIETNEGVINKKLILQ